MGRLSKEQSRRTTMGLGQKCKAVIFEPSSKLSTWASSGNSFDFCPKNERTIVVFNSTWMEFTIPFAAVQHFFDCVLCWKFCVLLLVTPYFYQNWTLANNQHCSLKNKSHVFFSSGSNILHYSYFMALSFWLVDINLRKRIFISIYFSWRINIGICFVRYDMFYPALAWLLIKGS